MSRESSGRRKETMAENDPAIIGTYSCGCVTLAIARPSEPLDRESRQMLTEHIDSGGSVERTTVGEARSREHFLVDKCPHKPKGWTPDA